MQATAAKNIRKVLTEMEKKKVGESGEALEVVRKAVEQVVSKMNGCRMGDLKPPYFPKTLTKYRMECYLPLKKYILPLISSKSEEEFQRGVAMLDAFVSGLDREHFDLFLEQVRGNYVRKIFQQNYELDIDLKEINMKYKLRNETDLLLNAASEWLIQIEATQDILERVELYFGIHAPWVIEKTIKEGNDCKEGGWLTRVFNGISKLYAIGLRKASKLFQTTLVTTIAPTAAMITLAVISSSGASALLPLQDINKLKALFAPLLAVTVPYVLEGLADAVDKHNLASALMSWSNTFDLLASSIKKFNTELETSIELCCNAGSLLAYHKERTNMEKFIGNLRDNYNSLNIFDEEKFDEMRERTEAYYRPYKEEVEGEWTIVTPVEVGHENMTPLQQEKTISESMLKGFLGVAKAFNKLKTVEEIEMELMKQCKVSK